MEGMPLQFFSNGVQVPLEGNLSLHLLQELFANWVSAPTIGGRVSAPKLLFCIVKSSTHWSNKQGKKNRHSCAWCSGTYLPASRQALGASLPATVWKVSQKKLSPLALGNASLPGDTFSPGGRRLPVFLTPLITSLPFPCMLQWVSVGKSQGLPHTLSPAISLQGEWLSAVAPRV